MNWLLFLIIKKNFKLFLMATNIKEKCEHSLCVKHVVKITEAWLQFSNK